LVGDDNKESNDHDNSRSAFDFAKGGLLGDDNKKCKGNGNNKDKCGDPSLRSG
jgi:hypothetical protein